MPYYLSDSEKKTMEDYIESFNVNDIVVSHVGFFIMSHIFIDCSLTNNTCFIESEFGVYYDLETKKISEQGSEIAVPYEDYLSSNESEDLTLEYFEFVHYLEELIKRIYY